MPTRIPRAVALAALLALLPAGRAYAVAGIAAIVNGTQYAYALLEEYEQNQASERDEARRREALRVTVSRVQNKMVPLAGEARATQAKLNERLKQLRDEHPGGGPESWSARDRAEYERTQQAAQELDQVCTDVEATIDNLKWINLHVQSPSFVPGRNQEFKDRFERLKVQLETCTKGMDEFMGRHNVETARRDDPNSPIVVVPATFVRVRNDAPDMIFEVNGVRLKPGETTAAQIRLGDHGAVSIRAIALDAVRQRILKTAETLAEGGTNQAKVTEKNLPYLLSYSTDRLSSSTRCLRERYEWTFGSQVQRSIGRASPWAPATEPTPAPEVGSSHAESLGNTPAISGDTVSWWLPRVEDTSVEFTFTAAATVDWKVGRKLASGQQTEQDQTEVTTATLSLTVSPR